MRLLWDINDHREKFVHIKITKNDCTRLPTIQCVDNGGFKALVRALELKYQIQSQRYICEIVISSILRTVQERVKKKLEEIQYVNLTTDSYMEFR